MLSFLNKVVSRVLIVLVHIYRWTLSPIIHVLSGPGAGCRFHPTCSEYAITSLREKTPIEACVLIFKRLSKCHPRNSGGYDPVP